MDKKLDNVNNAESEIIRKETLWNSIGNFVYLVSQWLLFYLVTRLMGYSDAGIFSLAMAVGGSLYLVASYSLRNYQTSDLDARFSRLTYVHTRIATCVLSLIICAVFLCIAQYTAYTAFCVFAYMVFKTSEAFSDVYQGILQMHREMEFVGKAYLIKSVLDTAIFCITLLATNNLLASMCALALTSWIEVMGYERKTVRNAVSKKLVDSERHPKTERISCFSKSQLAEIRNLLITCLPIAICGFSAGSIGQIPRIFLEWIMGEEMLGIYSSIAIPIVLLQVLCSYIFTPLIVPLTKHYNQGSVKQFALLLVKALFGVAVIAVAAFAAFVFLGEPVMGFLFGPSIIPYLYLMYPLLVSGVLVALFWFLITLLTIVRELKPLLILSLVTLASVLLGSQFFIKCFGINGATFIYIFALVIFIVCGCVILGINVSKKANAKA